MAETEVKWGQRLDLIAYGVAGLLGLILVAIPAFLGGQVDDQKVKDQQQLLDEKIAGQSDKLEKEDPIVKEALREMCQKQWEVGTASPVNPRWVTEIAPVFLRKVPEILAEMAVHEAGAVSEIGCQRDAEKKQPYLVVKGALNPKSQYVEVSKVSLFRKEDEGPFVELKDFALPKDFATTKAFEYADYSVKPGKTYTYKFVETAQLDPKAPSLVKFDAEKEGKKETEPLGPTDPVPYDFSLTISNIQPPTEANPVPRFFGRVSYWDYKLGKVVKFKGGRPVTFSEKDAFGETDKVAAGRYDFFPVEAATQSVTVRDQEKNLRYKFSGQEARLERPIDCWAEPKTNAPPKVVVEEEGTEGAETKETPAKTAKTGTAKTPAKKTTPKKGAEAEPEEEAAPKTKSKSTGKESAPPTTTKKKRFT